MRSDSFRRTLVPFVACLVIGCGSSDAPSSEGRGSGDDTTNSDSNPDANGDQGSTDDDRGSNSGNGNGSSTTDPGTGNGSNDPGPTPSGSNCLRGTGDYASDGPYEVASEKLTVGSENYTLYYPKDLDDDCLHPVVVWGNGMAWINADNFAHFHKRAASWGMVVAGAWTGASSAPVITGAIDYLLKENDKAESRFYHKLSQRAGAAGHSNGAMAAVSASGHPNIKAVVNLMGGGNPAKDVALLCETGANDSGREGCIKSYNAASGPAFLANHADADHLTPTRKDEPAMAMVRAYAAWLRCHLADDGAACALFTGSSDSKVCKESNWATCESRNF